MARGYAVRPSTKGRALCSCEHICLLGMQPIAVASEALPGAVPCVCQIVLVPQLFYETFQEGRQWPPNRKYLCEFWGPLESRGNRVGAPAWGAPQADLEGLVLGGSRCVGADLVFCFSR